jgi:hypothetical protein
MITFTTTATIRPSLIEQTYLSFSKQILDIDFKSCELIINVDPMPINNLIDRNKVISVAEKYFGKVTYNFPNTPNFPNALKWVWQNTKTDYIFNLEDDWSLNSSIKISDLMTLLSKNPEAIGVSLNAYVFAKDPFRLRLSPCILKGDWARRAASYLSPDMCPEQQIRRQLPADLMKPMLNFPEYSISSPEKIIVRDTGRAWRNNLGLIRNNGGTSNFTTWEKK